MCRQQTLLARSIFQNNVEMWVLGNLWGPVRPNSLSTLKSVMNMQMSKSAIEWLAEARRRWPRRYHDALTCPVWTLHKRCCCCSTCGQWIIKIKTRICVSRAWRAYWPYTGPTYGIQTLAYIIVTQRCVRRTVSGRPWYQLSSLQRSKFIWLSPNFALNRENRALSELVSVKLKTTVHTAHNVKIRMVWNNFDFDFETNKIGLLTRTHQEMR